MILWYTRLMCTACAANSAAAPPYLCMHPEAGQLLCPAFTLTYGLQESNKKAAHHHAS
jgi:hypothetical protein